MVWCFWNFGVGEMVFDPAVGPEKMLTGFAATPDRFGLNNFVGSIEILFSFGNSEAGFV